MAVHNEPTAMRAGVIVAGGRSKRFGNQDKVLADLAGVPMIRRVADRLADVVDELVVNCRVEQVKAIDAALAGVETKEVRFAPDPLPNLGPVAGIHVGCAAVTAKYAVVVAADMPLLDPLFLTYLFDRAACHDAAVPRLDDWLQPMQAVYHANAMTDACASALEEGERSVTEALTNLDCVLVEEDAIRKQSHPETLRNLNTREEFDAVAEELR